MKNKKTLYIAIAVTAVVVAALSLSVSSVLFQGNLRNVSLPGSTGYNSYKGLTCPKLFEQMAKGGLTQFINNNYPNDPAAWQFAQKCLDSKWNTCYKLACKLAESNTTGFSDWLQTQPASVQDTAIKCQQSYPYVWSSVNPRWCPKSNNLLVK